MPFSDGSSKQPRNPPASKEHHASSESRHTSSGIDVHRIYQPQDLQNFSEQHDLGRPGEYPFTRGIYPSMYRGRPWTMRQYAGFGSAREANQRYRYLLGHGTTGLS